MSSGPDAADAEGGHATASRQADTPAAAAGERIGDAWIEFDGGARCSSVNQAAADLFNRPPADWAGRRVAELFPGLVEACDRAAAERATVRVETRDADVRRWFEHNVYPSAAGLSMLVRDITARKDAEAAAGDESAMLRAQNGVLEGLARGEPLARSLDMLVRAVEARCPEMLCSIVVSEPGGARVHHLAAPSLPDSFTAALEGTAGEPCAAAFVRAALGGGPTVIRDVSVDALAEDCRQVALEQGIRAAWSSPIPDVAGGVLGAFAVYSRTPGEPGARHRHVIEVATQTAAIAIVHDRESAGRRANEERLRLAVTGGNVGIWEWDVPRDRFTWSDQLRAIIGWPIDAERLTLQDVLRVIHRDDRPLVEDALDRSIRWGVDYDLEYRVVGPGGVVRWIATKGGGEYRESSTPVRMMGVALDITTRKEAEIRLRQSEERFQLVARATNDAIWDWDVRGETLWWNQGVEALFGYGPNTIGASAAWRLAQIHPDDLEAVVSSVQAVTARGDQFWSGEFRFRRADGTYADVLDRGFLIYDTARRPVRMIGAMTDVSDRKRALDRLEQAVAARTAELHAQNQRLADEIDRRRQIADLLRGRNEELKAFAYTVSHDLKTPLRGIAGYAAELERRHAPALGERARHCVSRILMAAQNLDRLIEDLLRYARLDAETPTPVDVDLGRLIAVTIRDRAPLIAEHKTEVTAVVDVPRARLWERGVMQLVANLFDNALKYSRHAKPPRVRVSVAQRSDGAVRLTVADNGIGFDMKCHDRIFGLFHRLVRQEEFEGTGAGLAIARKVTEKMGGTIRAEASPGAGAAFIVDLPISGAAREPRQNQEVPRELHPAGQAAHPASDAAGGDDAR